MAVSLPLRFAILPLSFVFLAPQPPLLCLVRKFHLSDVVIDKDGPSQHLQPLSLLLLRNNGCMGSLGILEFNVGKSLGLTSVVIPCNPYTTLYNLAKPPKDLLNVLFCGMVGQILAKDGATTLWLFLWGPSAHHATTAAAGCLGPLDRQVPFAQRLAIDLVERLLKRCVGLKQDVTVPSQTTRILPPVDTHTRTRALDVRAQLLIHDDLEHTQQKRRTSANAFPKRRLHHWC